MGDILCRYFDAQGQIIDDEVHDRVIGIPMEVFGDERKLIIGVAGGAAKVDAIRAALLREVHQRADHRREDRGGAAPR